MRSVRTPGSSRPAGPALNAGPPLSPKRQLVALLHSWTRDGSRRTQKTLTGRSGRGGSAAAQFKVHVQRSKHGAETIRAAPAQTGTVGCAWNSAGLKLRCAGHDPEHPLPRLPPQISLRPTNRARALAASRSKSALRATAAARPQDTLGQGSRRCCAMRGSQGAHRSGSSRRCGRAPLTGRTLTRRAAGGAGPPQSP